ncbi:MAG: hypothetical protein GWN55_14815 [Phycisphaerae bacterium]|nr:hypothetical protein [Phycisphaerae bacterium]
MHPHSLLFEAFIGQELIEKSLPILLRGSAGHSEHIATAQYIMVEGTVTSAYSSVSLMVIFKEAACCLSQGRVVNYKIIVSFANDEL